MKLPNAEQLVGEALANSLGPERLGRIAVILCPVGLIGWEYDA